MDNDEVAIGIGVVEVLRHGPLLVGGLGVLLAEVPVQRQLVAETRDRKPVTAGDLKADGVYMDQVGCLASCWDPRHGHIAGPGQENGQTAANLAPGNDHLDPETIQVSMSHPYPGTELYQYLKDQGYLISATMTDELGHQLPTFEYPDLRREEILKGVEDFYARYYFRPRIIFRIVRRALFDGRERRRLYQEGRDFLRLRAKRKGFIHSGKSKK